MSFTEAQQRAIDAKGNTLVMAGAGTGKTKTLTARCMRFLLEADVTLDQILMVTFTEAAAAEMRRRIRQQLEEELEKDPTNSRLNEQVVLLDSAHICTLHSFCLKLIREHFYELALDPQLAVLAEQQSKLLAAETLDEIFAHHYAGGSEDSPAVLNLIQLQPRAKEQPLRELILELHEYTQTRPDPEKWFQGQLELFSQEKPEQWQCWLLEGLKDWAELSLPLLKNQDAENIVAHACARLLENLPQKLTREAAAQTVQLIHEQDEAWPPRKKTVFRKPLESFFKDAGFLHTLLHVDKTDPLAEDWEWVRSHMLTLLKLALEFEHAFSAVKRDSAAVDFHDLEQFSLRLLWDGKTNSPTVLAQEWRSRLKLVFVDEYQDINEAQDRILTALGSDGEKANRFLVGDVKQSIYRFRQAAPHIFQGYAERWRRQGGEGTTIPLSHNFRSHQAVLNFINPLFRELMRQEVGGVEFDKDAELQFGNPEGRAAYCIDDQNPGPRVEVHLRLKERGTSSGDENLDDLSDSEREARIVAERIQSLVGSGTLLWDQEEGCHRPVSYADIVILMRSPRSKVESYAKEFARLNLPLQASRSGFFESIEVHDMLNLLQLLDNPLQDIPAIAVLRSPLVGLSINELAEIRMAKRKAKSWNALLAFHEAQRENNTSTFKKVDAFLSNYTHWRSMARHSSLTQRLEMILNDTSYVDWLLTQPRGEQRQANVYKLLAVTREFEELQHQGLYRFLQYIQAQQEAAGDTEPAPLETENAVRLMSIHQSKGLEFPIVVIPDLGKKFNMSDASGSIILDEECGLCPMVRPPGTGASYPSLPYWLAKQRHRAEALGEELRILYVALTRAEQWLILTGTCQRATADKWQDKSAAGASAPIHLLKANSFLDWLGPWWTNQEPGWTEKILGTSKLWRWWIQQDGAMLVDGAIRPALLAENTQIRVKPASDEQFQHLKERLEWKYIYEPATREPAKASVTELRRQAAEQAESSYVPELSGPVHEHKLLTEANDELSHAEIGVAHHLFLQRVSLDRLETIVDLQQEADRLVRARMLSENEASALDLESVRHFWASEVGRKILDERDCLRRELPFTMRVAREEAAGFSFLKDLPEDEFVIVQGVVDVAIIRPEDIWILDFKTDSLREDEIAHRAAQYAPQIRLYGLALSRIYNRPVAHHWLYFLRSGKTVDV
jgi:ATP-dependent helicase/nuclease subunit A